jgi:hypothetical protein
MHNQLYTSLRKSLTIRLTGPAVRRTHFMACAVAAGRLAISLVTPSVPHGYSIVLQLGNPATSTTIIVWAKVLWIIRALYSEPFFLFVLYFYLVIYDRYSTTKRAG